MALEGSGTYILQTSIDEGYEYRVVSMADIDQIYGMYTEEGRFSPHKETIHKYFSPAKVFTNMEEAFHHADSIENDLKDTDQGICFISEFKDYRFEDFKEE